METSQGVKRGVLIQQAEDGVRKLLESLQTVEEGDLKGLQQQVLETIFAVGRGWMGLFPTLSVPACFLWMESTFSIVLQRKTLMKNEVNEDGSVVVSAFV
jgi:hypothetical protein